jgi:hypothetical protein
MMLEQGGGDHPDAFLDRSQRVIFASPICCRQSSSQKQF